MPAQIIERPCSAAETAVLTNLYETAQANRRQGLTPADVLLSWILLMSCFLVLWAIVSWLASSVLHADIGMHGIYGYQTFVTGGVVVALLMAADAARKVGRRRKHIRQLHEELVRGVVHEEHFTFTEARRFQEQEHGGLIYFLHSDDDRVYVMYDTESQQLRIDGGNPFNSSFVPGTRLVRVRAPLSGTVVSSEFSGFRLDTDAVFDMLADVQDWPEDGAYCDCAWTDLIARYASPASTAPG